MVCGNWSSQARSRATNKKKGPHLFNSRSIDMKHTTYNYEQITRIRVKNCSFHATDRNFHSRALNLSEHHMSGGAWRIQRNGLTDIYRVTTSSF